MRVINRVANTADGPFIGVPCWNELYTVFKGVPYAKPPVGELRWREPQRPEKHTDPILCDTFAPIAPQAIYQVTSGGRKLPLTDNKEHNDVDHPQSEDCLYLNIWTPDVDPQAKLPVMFWIHGGRYSSGSGCEDEVDGELYCRNDAILVSVQYRLGPFGYFAHPDLTAENPLHASGTLGVLDLIQALQWLHENIAAFGGDPDNITVSGQSAGGNLTDALITSPLSKGLVRRAIIMSTGILFDTDPHYTKEHAEEIGVKVCEQLGMTIADLRALPTMEAYHKIMDAANAIGELEFMPAIDGVVFPEQVYESLAKGNHHPVDIMVGSVSGDSVIGRYNAKTPENFARLANDLTKAHAGELADLFHAHEGDDMDKLYKLEREIFPRFQPLTLAMAEMKNGHTHPLYLYYFNRHLPGDDMGAYHSGELWYTFGTLARSWRAKEHCFTGEDYMLSETMNRYWTNFMRTGDPNGDGLPSWSGYTAAEPSYMYFTEKGAEPMPYTPGDLLWTVSDWFTDSRMGRE